MFRADRSPMSSGSPSARQPKRCHARTVLAGLPAPAGVSWTSRRQLAGVVSALDRPPRASRGFTRAGARRAVRWRRNAGGARRPGLAVTGALARRPRSCVPDSTAYAPRPPLRRRHPRSACCGDAWQARARPVAARADRGERRQEPAAPGRGGSSTMPQKRNPGGHARSRRLPQARARPRVDDADRCGSGARARPRQLAGGGRRARDRALAAGALTPVEVVKDSRSMRLECRQTSRSRRDDIREAVQMALSQARTRHRAFARCRRLSDGSGQGVHFRDILAQNRTSRLCSMRKRSIGCSIRFIISEKRTPSSSGALRIAPRAPA